jgi:DNA-binding response OmpR family regulator
MNVLVAVADLGLRALWEGILHEHGHRTLPVSPNLPEWNEAHTFALDIAIIELAPAHPQSLELCRRLRISAGESRPALLVLVQPAEVKEMLVSLRITPDDVVVGHPDRRTAASYLVALERRRYLSLLPKQPAPVATLASSPSVPTTILLIDDEPSIRHSLRIVLQQAGYRVIEANDAEDGLEVIARQGDELSLIVSDQHMRRISGLELLRQVRRRPRRIPVVLMSGYPSLDPPDGVDGPDAYLRKPFDLRDLEQTVRRLVEEDSARA